MSLAAEIAKFLSEYREALPPAEQAKLDAAQMEQKSRMDAISPFFDGITTVEEPPVESR